MKKLILSVIAVFFSIHTYATEQAPDRIIYRGQEYSLYGFSNPLEAWFEKFPDKRPVDGIMTSALWRGYIATFEVIDDQLFVVNIEIEVADSVASDSYSTKWISVMDDVFPSQPRVKVDWLSGLLVIPCGEIVEYVLLGNDTYSEYALLEFHDGNLTAEKMFDQKSYKQFKERQFQAFKQTDEYQKHLQEMDDFLREFVIEYSSRILTD